MKTRLILVFAVISAAFFLTACQSQQSATVYDFSAVANDGSEVKLADYKGKVLLIVNTASQCGFTPQYDGLEALYKKYMDKGLVIIGFPCDQFGHQEPGTNEEIVEFCRLNYGVTFPLMEKIEVNGENAQFMDQMLSRVDAEYASNPDIKWNFTKFLIDRKGRVVARFEPVVTPEALDAEIDALL